MSKITELKIKDNRKIYQELAQKLSPYRKKSAGSSLFIVEGTKQKPIVGIRYPGKKVKKREGKQVRIKWANLYDFEVVPFENGKKKDTKKFTFTELLKDFQENKKDSEKFWKLLEEMYYKNKISEEPPELKGIESKLYLLVLKWIWLQEDFNYRLGWQEVDSPVQYRLETRTAAKSVGRARLFAVLTLLRNHFTLEQVEKINPTLLVSV